MTTPKPPTSPWVYVVITCGVVFVIAMIVCGIFSWGIFKQLAPQMQEATRLQEDFKQIYAALDRYRIDHKGQWPDSLSQLIPDYIPAERKNLVMDPGKVGLKEADRLLTYYKPPENATAGYVVLEREIRGAQPNMSFRVLLRKNGEVSTDVSSGQFPGGR
jgi:type II secretory pathway pseudopilin PulG